MAALALLPACSGAWAQDGGTGYTLYGSPGLIDMPTGDQAAEGTLATTLARSGQDTRVTVTFQVSPRLSGSFRYSALGDFDNPASVDGTYYDRSFDLRYQLLTEGRLRPAVTVGFQDFVGTGLFSGEYIAATKTLSPRLQATAGLGWGRFASNDPIGSTGTRPPIDLDSEGGTFTADQWFRGDVAAFGGLSFALSDKVTLLAEYSSDAYTLERANGPFDGTSQVNYGLQYRFDSGTMLSLYHTYGSQIAAQLTFAANAREPVVTGGLENAPLPVTPRPAGSAQALGWTQQANAPAILQARLARGLSEEGLTLEGAEFTATKATLRLSNRRYGAQAQAIGRAARVMTRSLPGSIEEFVLVFVEDGLAGAAVTLQRSDLEALEFAPSDQILPRVQFADSKGLAPAPGADEYPRLRWALSPGLEFSFFDPNNPLRADARVRLGGRYDLSPGLSVSGRVSQKVAGNLSDTTRNADAGGLPPVRTDFVEYNKQGTTALDYLTAAARGRPAENLYARVTAGYLERMYAGISGEVMWKPVDSRLALGAEVNYVRQRDFEQGFALRDYDAFTGHASVYYEFAQGYHARLDMGQYLAGDRGATLALDRIFANGWRVGAYATVTDASAEDFGEGSFDKGIVVELPISWASAQPSRQTAEVRIAPLTRNGGARLNVPDRLYDDVRQTHRPEAAKTWGRFWR